MRVMVSQADHMALFTEKTMGSLRVGRKDLVDYLQQLHTDDPRHVNLVLSVDIPPIKQIYPWLMASPSGERYISRL